MSSAVVNDNFSLTISSVKQEKHPTVLKHKSGGRVPGKTGFLPPSPWALFLNKSRLNRQQRHRSLPMTLPHVNLLKELKLALTTDETEVS